MSTIINGTSNAITFPDNSIQNTSAIVSGYVPYANLPAGSVLQVVSATTTTTVNTASDVSASTTLTASITPKFSSSKVLALMSFSEYATADSNQSGAGFTLYKNGSTLATLGANVGYIVNTTQTIMPLFFQYLDSPATTSSTTYTVWFTGGSGGTATVQRSGNPSYITLMEIAA